MEKPNDFVLLGIAESLRRQSHNRSLLRGLYCSSSGRGADDVRHQRHPAVQSGLGDGPAQSVRAFKRAVQAADAILFATPEYNYSIPGVLKNAIDAASRPHDDNAWAGKPVAVVGASVGLIGTARARCHLRQSFVFLNIPPINRPEVFVIFAEQKFDREGKLLDPVAKKLFGELLENLVSWSRRLAQEPIGVLVH